MKKEKSIYDNIKEPKTDEKQRTTLQNRALHLFFANLSHHFNERGLDMRKVLNPGIEIPWSPQTVKEYIWRPIQKALLLKESTKDLNTKDIDKVFDTINRHLGEKFGLTEPFPSIEAIMEKMREQEDKIKFKNKNVNNKRISSSS